MGYLPLEFALFLGKGLGLKEMRAAIQKPMVFGKDRPRLLVPKIVEAFQRLREEPPFLDVTLNEFSRGGWPFRDIPAVWPQVYIDHLPCGAKRSRKNSARQGRLVVEKFHFPSKHFDKQLTVELHFTLEDAEESDEDHVRPATAAGLEKIELLKVTLRLDNPSCGGPPSGKSRASKSLLRFPEFASEVYGFLDRVHVGTSLLTNRALKKLIFKLRNRLPVHHLSCGFERQFRGMGCVHMIRGAYWLVLRHFRSDLPYSDWRRFNVPSEAGPAADCSLLRRYLSNSHLSDFKTPHSDSRFAMNMLAALANRNFSVGTLRMDAYEDGLSDYRHIDTVFNGGMRLATLEMSLYEHELATLVKTVDFFRMPTIQRLKSLKLELGNPWVGTEPEPRRRAVVPPSLWIAGIRLLLNAERFEVKYKPDRHLPTIALKLVQFCEKFERGEVSELVQYFKFATSCYTAFPFKDVNRNASKVKVNDYEWDVYRFRNATTGEWLTVCVGHELTTYSTHSVLHIVKEDAHPDASFAAESE